MCSSGGETWYQTLYLYLKWDIGQISIQIQHKLWKAIPENVN